MTADLYVCDCGEGQLRPAYAGGKLPVLGCTACGFYTEPDPNHPDADPKWLADVIEMFPPAPDDDEHGVDGDRPPEDFDLDEGPVS